MEFWYVLTILLPLQLSPSSHLRCLKFTEPTLKVLRRRALIRCLYPAGLDFLLSFGSSSLADLLSATHDHGCLVNLDLFSYSMKRTALTGVDSFLSSLVSLLSTGLWLNSNSISCSEVFGSNQWHRFVTCDNSKDVRADISYGLRTITKLASGEDFTILTSLVGKSHAASRLELSWINNPPMNHQRRPHALMSYLVGPGHTLQLIWPWL